MTYDLIVGVNIWLIDCFILAQLFSQVCSLAEEFLDLCKNICFHSTLQQLSFLQKRCLFCFAFPTDSSFGNRFYCFCRSAAKTFHLFLNYFLSSSYPISVPCHFSNSCNATRRRQKVSENQLQHKVKAIGWV